MSEPKSEPRRIFKLGEERYVQVVFLIKSRSVRGIPMECVLLEDEQVIHLEEGMEFMTGLVKETMLEGSL